MTIVHLTMCNQFTYTYTRTRALFIITHKHTKTHPMALCKIATTLLVTLRRRRVGRGIGSRAEGF